MAKTLIFGGRPQDRLFYSEAGEDGPSVYGGQEFVVDDDRALELLTNPHIPIQEVEQELKSYSRSELEKIAADLGIAEPGNFVNKAALVEAIETHPQPNEYPTQGETT